LIRGPAQYELAFFVFLNTHQGALDESKIMGYTVISKIVPTSSEEKRRKRERLAWLLEQ
jgi:hypothetical protein